MSKETIWNNYLTFSLTAVSILFKNSETVTEKINNSLYKQLNYEIRYEKKGKYITKLLL